jgi:phosphohistidine phosphatase
MILYLVRHAWAGDHGDPRYPDDSQRPVTEKGHKRFQNWLTHLDNANIRPTLIFSSPYVRCIQTAEMVQRWLQKTHHHQAKLQPIDSLASGAELDDVLSSMRDFLPSNGTLGDLMWVGHMPDLSLMTEALISDSRASIHFAKGAIAAIEFADAPTPARGILQWLASPKIAGE